MDKLSKKQKKHLRELVDTAYERDLSKCLLTVASRFEAWKENEISVWDLNQVIHEFHNDIARELYKAYTMTDKELAVAFGVVQEVLSLDEIDETCRDRISKLAELISKGGE